MLRVHDQGQDMSEDIAAVLARVYQDLKAYPGKIPGAIVTAELKTAGLYDRLKLAAPTRVGGPPTTAQSSSDNALQSYR